MDDRMGGWINGMIGVTIFAGSLPATRLAVMGLDPVFVTFARAFIAALIALATLVLMRQRRPRGADWISLAIVAGGVVVGFPLATALALSETTSAHANIFIGLLPLATALFAVIRAGERPGRAFWAFALAGGACVAGFALSQGRTAAPLRADLILIAGILVCGLGYAEGARLSRRLGGWQVICWALVLSLPVSAVIAALRLPGDIVAVPTGALLGLAYVSVFSMLVGFVFWYRGLALGGIAAVGQLQLLQPFMALALSALVLGETVTPAMIAVMGAVVLCVWGARRAA